MIVYKLTNIKNNKIYIGITTEKKGIKERCRKRNCEAKYRDSRSSYILNAIRKHGEESFISEQIDTANSLDELKQKEIYYIKLFNSTDRNIDYNLTSGGDGSFGYKMSNETKAKIGKKLEGKLWSEERKLKHSKILKSSGLTFESGIKNCKAYNLKTSKKVAKYNIEGKLLKTYNSIADLQKKEYLDRSGISNYLNSDKAERGKTYKGYIYKIIRQ